MTESDVYVIDLIYTEVAQMDDYGQPGASITPSGCEPSLWEIKDFERPTYEMVRGEEDDYGYFTMDEDMDMVFRARDNNKATFNHFLTEKELKYMAKKWCRNVRNKRLPYYSFEDRESDDMVKDIIRCLLERDMKKWSYSSLKKFMLRKFHSISHADKSRPLRPEKGNILRRLCYALKRGNIKILKYWCVFVQARTEYLYLRNFVFSNIGEGDEEEKVWMNSSTDLKEDDLNYRTYASYIIFNEEDSCQIVDRHIKVMDNMLEEIKNENPHWNVRQIVVDLIKKLYSCPNTDPEPYTTLAYIKEKSLAYYLKFINYRIQSFNLKVCREFCNHRLKGVMH